jgi:hypothetical protein
VDARHDRIPRRSPARNTRSLEDDHDHAVGDRGGDACLGAARGLGALAAEASGSTVIAMEDYEVVFFEGELVGKEEPT